jgi:hypothetical protein
MTHTCHSAADVEALTPSDLVGLFSRWKDPTLRLERDGETIELRRPRTATDRRKLLAVIRKILIGETLHFTCPKCNRPYQTVEVARG